MSAPLLGSVLHLRGEILLGLALPPAGSAALALAVLLGVPRENTAALYLVAGMALFLLVTFLPQGSGRRRRSYRQREIVLATVFSLGHTLTLLFMALSPDADAHLRHLLNGEILAVRPWELALAATTSLGLVALSILKRGQLFAFALDEEGFSLKAQRPRLFAVSYRLAAVVIVTGGVILVGPLLCTALLVLPPLFAEKAARGMESYLRSGVVIGLIGTSAGFLAAIGLDLPPAPVAGVGLLLSGLASMLLVKTLRKV